MFMHLEKFLMASNPRPISRNAIDDVKGVVTPTFVYKFFRSIKKMFKREIFTVYSNFITESHSLFTIVYKSNYFHYIQGNKHTSERPLEC